MPYYDLLLFLHVSVFQNKRACMHCKVKKLKDVLDKGFLFRD